MAATAGVVARSSAAPATLLSSAPPTSTWVAFAKTLNGPVYLPGTSQYNASKLIFDTRYDGNRPAAVVQIVSTSDVQKTMAFASRYGYQVSPRAGGHSYVGASAANGTIVIDARKYAGMRYDANTRTAQVYSGATLYNVHNFLAGYGRSIPTGTCPTVGAAGLTLGGGLGVDSRTYGLTCDRVTKLTMILPTGAAITATPTTYSDIFWAARGGGGGNIGFVTSLTYATHPATSRGIFGLTFPSSAGSRVLTGWAKWIATTANSRWVNVHVDTAGGGAIRVSVVGVTNVGDERAAAASLISAVGISPTSSYYKELSAMDTVRFLGGGTTSPRQGFSAGSDILSGMSSTTASAILGSVGARSRAGASGTAILDPLTGAVGAPAVSATAFPWRDHLASVQWYVGGTGYTSAQNWIASAHNAIRASSSGGYVNYLETGQPASRFYGSNLARLAHVRATYDPQRRIHSGLNV